MDDSMRQLQVTPSAISHNVSTLRHHSAQEHTMVVVKADGYGHGATLAARAALEGGASWLGTADIDEALELRKAGIMAPTLAWLIGPQSNVADAIEQGIDLGLSSLGQLEQVAAAASRDTPAMIHVEVDSGMGRGGVVEADWSQWCARAKTLHDAGIVVVRGVFTHMAATSAESDRAQAARFDHASAVLADHGIEAEYRHLSSSLPAARDPDLGGNMVRLGIAAYGVPVAESHHALGLRPAMRLSGTVILVKRLPAGHGVGYDHTYTTNKETTLVVVPLGYADGIPRHASSLGVVSSGGKRFVLSGRVSMDQVSIDVGDLGVAVGDEVVFWGDPERGEPHVSEWASLIGTNAYELLTRIGPRVDRVVR